MIHGLRTAAYAASEVARGEACNTAVLGPEPYFDEPFYAGFLVGGFEPSLIPDAEPGTPVGVRLASAVDPP